MVQLNVGLRMIDPAPFSEKMKRLLVGFVMQASALLLEVQKRPRWLSLMTLLSFALLG